MAADDGDATTVVAPMPCPEEEREQPSHAADSPVDPMTAPPPPLLEEEEQQQQPPHAADARVDPMTPPPLEEEEEEQQQPGERTTTAADAVVAPMPPPPPLSQPEEKQEEQPVPAAALPQPLESGPASTEEGHKETSEDKNLFKVPGPADEGHEETSKDKIPFKVPGLADDGHEETSKDKNPLKVPGLADEDDWETCQDRKLLRLLGRADERYHKGIGQGRRPEDDDLEDSCGCSHYRRSRFCYRHEQRDPRYYDHELHCGGFRRNCYPNWHHSAHLGNGYPDWNGYPGHPHRGYGYPVGRFDQDCMDLYNPRLMDSWDDKLVDTQCCSWYKLTRGKNDFPVAASLSNPEKWICFLNCILQCVVHTVPLVSKLLKDRHLGPCPTGSDEFCCYCSLRHHASEVIRLSGDVLYPRKFVKRLKSIFRDFEQGQHQDAHEFLRCLLDKLDEVTVAPRSESEEPSSIVKEFFGGQLKSQLNCPKCNHCSDRLESFLDLNLEVNQMDTIMDSLSSYTKIEVVEDFICDGCKSRVNMEKHLKVEQAPEVLVIQLKRFQNLGSDISKIHDMVKYQLELDLNPFMSSPDDKPQCYDLYGVVEHWGNTAKGHYVCYIRSSETDWFLFDDDKIVKMTEDRLLEKKAYVLFYVKKGSSPWFSTLLEKKEMLLSDYFEELAGKGLDEDGAPKAGSYSSSGSDSDNDSVEQDVTEHFFGGPAEKNEAGPSSAGLSQGVQGIENGSTLCSVPDKNEVGCSLGVVPSGGTQKPTSLTLSSVENGDASGLPLLLENKEKSSHGTREANHNGPSSEVLDADSHIGSSQENGRSCNLLQSSSHKHEDYCPENLTLHEEEEEEDGMAGSCDSPAGSLHARGSAGTSRLGTMSESRPEQGSG
ncbi:uncharacterized protein [Triticum aestivum]|uniref:uncharacterized protein isoform X2 n=1 Tax=Triticum aestivum TaxID=4565 RepID=UPI001D022A3C|nr:uncharacterized protein LOC123125837 isoform X2 [Triticum aestivum]